MWNNSCHRSPLKSMQHELSSGSSTHREGATPTRFGPRPRNRDRMPSFSRMALQKEMNRQISIITKMGALLLCSSVLLIASPPHILWYPFFLFLPYSHFLSNHFSPLLQSFLPILVDTITLGLVKPLAEKFLTVPKAALQTQSTGQLR